MEFQAIQQSYSTVDNGSPQPVMEASELEFIFAELEALTGPAAPAASYVSEESTKFQTDNFDLKTTEHQSQQFKPITRSTITTFCRRVRRFYFQAHNFLALYKLCRQQSISDSAQYYR